MKIKTIQTKPHLQVILLNLLILPQTLSLCSTKRNYSPKFTTSPFAIPKNNYEDHFLMNLKNYKKVFFKWVWTFFYCSIGLIEQRLTISVKNVIQRIFTATKMEKLEKNVFKNCNLHIISKKILKQ